MLQDFCKDIYENTNYQINTHCIGDSANRLLLDIYGQQLKGKNDRRWRIEHAQLVDPTDRALFKQYSIIPSVQPTHATSDAPWVSTRICDNRMASAYAYQSLLKQNDYLALGTDFPVEYIDPFFTIYSAVFRLSAQRAQDKAFLADEALSMDQTLKGMTIWAAKACRLEQRKGSLSKGKDADLVVIDRDFYHLPNPKALLSSKVIATYALGQKVY
jgi:predicted amidohydrolase YtcJ